MVLILLFCIWFFVFKNDDNIERVIGLCYNDKNKESIVEKKKGVRDVKITLPDKHVVICIYSDHDVNHQRACKLIDSNRGDEYNDFMMMAIGTKVMLLFFFSNF